MLNQILKILFAFPLLVIIVVLLVVNVNLYEEPNIELLDGDTINIDLLHELRGLKKSIAKGADEDMQQLYPEGYIFLNSIYALTWCNFINELDPASKYFKEGKSEIIWSLDKINSDEGQSIFDEHLPFRYGAFYNGWSNYVLGKKLVLDHSSANMDEAQVLYFKEQCARIDSALADYTFPVTYRGSAWPADAMMCVTSLSLHDKLFAPKYGSTIQKWLKDVKTRLDSNGSIPHSVRASTGQPAQPARGSSQSLMLIMLYDLDREFAREQFSIYKESFVDRTMGLAGVREYPKGVFGLGDVDSGPLVFGYGAAATIVGMQTLALFGEHENSSRINHLVESFALSYDNGDEKKYLFGLLPIADAFIAWGHSAIKLYDHTDVSFLSFHCWSLFIVLCLSTFFWLLVRPKKLDSINSLTIPW